MSEIAHTPTPWQIEGKYAGDSGSLYLSTMHPMPVFELLPVVGVEAEHVANADFIVTAVNAYDKQRALIETLVKALEEITLSAESFHDAATPYFSDSTYDGDGILAETEAHLSVTAIPSSRAALAAAKEQSA